MGIASSVLDVVRAEAEKRPGARITKVALRVGEWSGVDAGALRFCFEVIAPEYEVAIETQERRNRCPACDNVFRVTDYQVGCPACGAWPTAPVSGDELEIAYMEIEEP